MLRRVLAAVCTREAAMAKCNVGGLPEHYIAELVCGTARRPGSDTTSVCLPKRPLVTLDAPHDARGYCDYD